MKRRDLAMMYFPDKSPVEALRRWIDNCPALVASLDDISPSHKKKQILTARQVRIIMEYLGDP